MPKGVPQARPVLERLVGGFSTSTMRILAPVGYCERQRSLCVTLSLLVHVAGRQAVQLRGPAISVKAPARLGNLAENLGAQVWGTTSTNGPVRPQPIPRRELAEPLPEALSDLGSK